MKDSSQLYSSVAEVLRSFGGDRSGRNLDKDVRQELTRLKMIVQYIANENKNREGIALKVLEIGLGFSLVTTAIARCFNQEEAEISSIEHPGREELKDPAFLQHLEETHVSLKEVNICEFQWPYEDSLFDIVIFSETIEHLEPTVVPRIINEISRILVTGGILIISTPNLGAWRYRSRLMRGKAIFDEALPLEWAGGTYAHIRLYTADEIVGLCQYYGFERTLVEYANYGLLNKRGGFKRAVYKLFHKMFPAMSPDMFVILRKI